MPEPDLTWLQDFTLWQVAAWVAGIIVIIVLLRKGWPWLRAAVHLLETLGTLADDMAALKTNIGDIKHEVLPNGGSSLKDQATRTEEALIEIKGDVTKLGGDVSHIRRQQAATKTALARTEKTLKDHLAPTKEKP